MKAGLTLVVPVYNEIGAIENSIITLKNVKYPLSNFELNRFDPLGLSNEIIGVASLQIHQGLVMVIQSKDQ